MVMGGVVYSVDFVIFVEKPNPRPGVFGLHELWHLLVVVPAVLHYLLTYSYVLPA
jgi:hemolysin III